MAEQMNNQEVKYDIVIIGGGVAGAALASVMARDGRRVLCIERNMGYPDRIIGEYLQPGGVHTVNELGLAGLYFYLCRVFSRAAFQCLDTLRSHNTHLVLCE